MSQVSGYLSPSAVVVTLTVWGSFLGVRIQFGLSANYGGPSVRTCRRDSDTLEEPDWRAVHGHDEEDKTVIVSIS